MIPILFYLLHSLLFPVTIYTLICDKSCNTCHANTSTSCDSCNTTWSRIDQSNSSNTCPCSSKFYDNGISTCSSCIFQCQNCNQSASNCTTCLGDRQSPPLCSCISGYYDDQVSLNCTSCKFQCKNCSQQAFNCTTCLGDRLSPPNCSCSNGKYDDSSSLNCSSCQFQCQNCNQSASNFTSCRGDRQSPPLCSCISGYYDDSVSINCTTCNLKCQNCSSPSGNCSTCISQRQQSPPNCTCPIRTYDTSTLTCTSCHYSCESCNGTTSTTCLSCSSSDQRILSGKSCLCQKGFYDDQNNITSICSSCHYSCQSCNGNTSTKCLSCAPYRFLTTNSCFCNGGSYEVPNNSICSACHYSCDNCTGPNNYSCTSCLSSRFRQGVTNNTCPCQDFFYEAGGKFCKKCHYDCLTCVQDSFCTSCDSGGMRSFQSNTCTCSSNYYDTYKLSCTPSQCTYSCATCSGGTQTNQSQTCLSCGGGNSRYFDIAKSTCPCSSGFYDSFGWADCQFCALFCSICTSSSYADCSLCADIRTNPMNQCPCPNGYYDNSTLDLSQNNCLQCYIQCQTCVSTNSNCTTCASNRENIPQCTCPPGYYDSYSYSNITCPNCSPQCATCTSSADNCQTCILNPAPQCNCPTHYRDIGLTQNCSECDYKCNNCAINDTDCSDCAPDSHRISSPGCTCSDGTFDQPNVSICQSCLYRCATCVTNSTNCLSCFASRNFNDIPNCSCPALYYDDGSSQLCQKCNYVCATCATNSTNCLTCFASRIATDIPLCSCPAQYYDDGYSQLCQNCNYVCATCSINATNCQTCFAGRNQSDTPNCSCLSGYFDNQVSSCQLCSPKCLTCVNSSSNCLQCTGLNRSNIAPPCICFTGYYDDGTNSNCLICSYRCLTCINSSTNCLICQGINRSIIAPLCLCNNGYYDDGKNSNCQNCSNQCLSCVNSSTNCLTCIGINRNNTVSCVCYDGYYDDGNNPDCQSHHQITVQTICGQISLYIQGNGIKQYNEECDDGNSINHDGCSSHCKVEIGFQCSESNNFSTCTLSLILNCLQTVLNSGIPFCQTCSQQYFLSNDSQTCIMCNKNCDGCTGQNDSSCLKCQKNTITIKSVVHLPQVQLTCKECEYFYGLYSIFAEGCNAFCGDGIVRFDKGEQCDDGNQLSGDGCSSQCLEERDFLCLPQQYVNQKNQFDQNSFGGTSECSSLKLGPNATLKYQKKNDQLLLIFSHNITQEDFCSSFTIQIQSLDYGWYSFISQNITQNSCFIQLVLNTSLSANQLITLTFNQTITDQQNRILITNFCQLQSQKYDYYSLYQQAQAQTVVNAQSYTNKLILFLGLCIIFMGGVEVYWTLIDIMTWVDALYFINVEYPLNLRLFFQYTSWTGIFQIPNLITLNQPTDYYYQPGPDRFNDQGMTGCFLASVVGDIQFCMVGALVYLISVIGCSALERIYTQTIQSRCTSSQLFKLDDYLNNSDLENKQKGMGDQLKFTLPRYLVSIYNQFRLIRNGAKSIFIKLLLLVFLDFQMASLLQIQAGEFNKHPFITLNIILAIFFQICGVYLPFYFYFVINKSPILLLNEQYKMKFSAIYDGIIINEAQGKIYCIFSIIKKTFFVYCLTCFYDQPVLQSVTCSIACCLNLILIFFKSPFDNKTDLIRILIPEIAIFGSLATTILFALDDQINIFTNNFRFQLGCLILFLMFTSVLVQCFFLLKMIGSVIKKRFQLLHGTLFVRN